MKRCWIVWMMCGSAASCGGTVETEEERTPDGGSETAAPHCLPACFGRACGPDGCGGTCGGCTLGQTCTARGQCESLALRQRSCRDTPNERGCGMVEVPGGTFTLGGDPLASAATPPQP